jgi:hypothetical protein
MTSVFKDLIFGLSRGFGIYFSQRNDFIDSVMTPARVSKKSH